MRGTNQISKKKTNVTFLGENETTSCSSAYRLRSCFHFQTRAPVLIPEFNFSSRSRSRSTSIISFRSNLSYQLKSRPLINPFGLDFLSDPNFKNFDPLPINDLFNSNSLSAVCKTLNRFNLDLSSVINFFMCAVGSGVSSSSASENSSLNFPLTKLD